MKTLFDSTWVSKGPTLEIESLSTTQWFKSRTGPADPTVDRRQNQFGPPLKTVSGLNRFEPPEPTVGPKNRSNRLVLMEPGGSSFIFFENFLKAKQCCLGIFYPKTTSFQSSFLSPPRPCIWFSGFSFLFFSLQYEISTLFFCSL